MADKRWKAVERNIARLLGGVRVPVSGRQRGDQPDIEHPQFSVEVKSRNTIPQWLCEAVEQATASATEDRVPLVVLHQNGRRYADALVVVRLADFQRLTSQDLAETESPPCA